MHKKRIVLLSAFLVSGMLVSACWSAPQLARDGQPTIPSTPQAQGYTSSPVPATSTPEVTPTPAFTPTPTRLPVEISDVKGVPMRLVPVGEFTMGSSADVGLAECQKFRDNCERKSYLNEEPPHKVTLDGFYMDVYEVTNARYQACVDAGFCVALPKSEGRGNNYTGPGFEDYPIDFRDWNTAQTYCEWRQARLPTEAEWEKAARGPDQRTYPWGEGNDPSYANNHRPTTFTRVGSYELGVSPYGMYDMAGNAPEWVADWYDGNYYANSPSANPTGPETGFYRVIRGQTSVRTSARGYSIVNWSVAGFRCARSIVEPANVTLTPPDGNAGATQPARAPAPVPLPAERIDERGVPMKLVPAGPFVMGSPANGQPAEQPQQTLTLGAFYMDVYEVTNARYRACVEAGVCSPQNLAGAKPPYDHFGSPQYDDYPVAGDITWGKARTYCAWRGARLPTEAEWEKAARGTDQRSYPWGDGSDEILANLGQKVQGTSAVGSYPTDVSPYGMYDMAGNVMEWVSSLYRGYPYRADDGREDLSHFGSRVLRGGAWDQYVGDSLTTNRTGYDAITTAYSFIGFRCAFSYWEPTPTATSIPPTVTPEATPTATGVPPTLGPEPSSTPTMIPLPDQITDAHGVIMRHIPAGPFSMGSDKNDADEMPRHSLTLGEIYMDAYEVSNALYKACVKARGCSEPLNPASHTRSSYYDNAQYDNYPVIYVNWDQAKTFCEWRGTRLPSEAEWEKAAGGDLEQKTYPWGEAVIGKTLANYNRFVGDTSAVGSYPDGVSSYGLYDMAGNVWEWVADWYDRYPQNTTSNKNFGTTDRVIRGGSWYDFANSVRVSARNFYPPDRGNPNVGFRCVRSFP